MPRRSAKTTRTGRTNVEATTRGTTRYFAGFVASVTSASICSVTFMVPSSAAMAAPTRPETMSPANTGPSSRVMERATTDPTKLVAWKRWNPDQLWRARTIPVNVAVTRTTGRERIPTSSICFTMFRISEGGRTSHATHCRNRTKTFPRSSSPRNTRVPNRSSAVAIPLRFCSLANAPPRDAAPHLGEDLVGDGAGEAGQIVGRGPPLSHHHDVGAHRNAGDIGHVQHRVVHAHPAGDRRPAAHHRHRCGAGKSAPVAVGVPQRHHGDLP